MNLPGCLAPRAALRSVVLKPSVNHSVRYVGWKIATSTYPTSKTSLIRSSSEYFWNFSIGQWVSAGARPWYAWKHSIQPFAYRSAPGTQLSGAAFQ